MSETENRMLTAGDLMSRDVETVSADLPLRQAAKRLARSAIHGAPVVDGEGRCVGVLSVTDLARWSSGQGEPRLQRARTCAFQEKYREPGGREIPRIEPRRERGNAIELQGDAVLVLCQRDALGQDVGHDLELLAG